MLGDAVRLASGTWDRLLDAVVLRVLHVLLVSCAVHETLGDHGLTMHVRDAGRIGAEMGLCASQLATELDWRSSVCFAEIKPVALVALFDLWDLLSSLNGNDRRLNVTSSLRPVVVGATLRHQVLIDRPARGIVGAAPVVV